MRRRQRVILFALASGAAVFWVAFDASVRVEPPSATADRDPQPVARAAGPELPARAAFRDAGTDPFSPRAAQAARALAPRPPAAPSAPALPYRFVGRVYLEGDTQTFVARGARVFAVGKGDVLDGEYRVEAVTGTELAFIHLPSGSRQVLQFTQPIEDEARFAREAPTRQARLE